MRVKSFLLKSDNQTKYIYIYKLIYSIFKDATRILKFDFSQCSSEKLEKKQKKITQPGSIH